MLIRYFAGAADAAGHENETVDAAGMTVGSLRSRLTDGNEQLGKVLAVAALLADGARVESDDDDLSDVSQLDILPPFAGG